MNLPPPIAAENLALSPNIMPSPTPEGSIYSSPNVGSAAAQPTGIPLPVPSAPLPVLPVTNVLNTTGTGTPSVADDSDLIEKEWVQKAKEIISKTQNNPHEQSKELNIFKADYMQKRYNKVLKLSE